MSSGFYMRVGGGKYVITFETDNREHYELVQTTCRRCVDTNPKVVHKMCFDCDYYESHFCKALLVSTSPNDICHKKGD